MSKRKRPVYRDGRIHVLKTMCATCIFRPGNLMELHEGRVDQMVRDATANDSCIPCHTTLDGNEAVCHGFFRLHPSLPLRIAKAMDLVEFVTPPNERSLEHSTRHFTIKRPTEQNLLASVRNRSEVGVDRSAASAPTNRSETKRCNPALGKKQSTTPARTS